jgi:hypothetical protein
VKQSGEEQSSFPSVDLHLESLDRQRGQRATIPRCHLELDREEVGLSAKDGWRWRLRCAYQAGKTAHQDGRR